ncbi:MAG: type II toxin-antitoxin system RelE/ParE family toxin [Gammaproteobacteria bacterium]|nr:type II toxin-antitoxin system RelE/ParE family toxin [Gammaproteobacteria bacterium]
MIKGFACRDTRALFETGKSKRFAGIKRVAERKLALLHAAESLEFLRAPPGNRLQPLHGDRAGQYSIRINDQYRLCFTWQDGNAENVAIVDYH